MSNVLAKAKKILRIAQRGERIKLTADQRQQAYKFMEEHDRLIASLNQCDKDLSNYMTAIIHGKGYKDGYRFDKASMSLIRVDESEIKE